MPARTSASKHIFVPCVLALVGISASAQVAPADSAHKTPVAFDVVSIKPSDPNKPRGGFQLTADGYSQSASPLLTAIRMAYLPMAGNAEEFVKNVPAWVNDDLYDITAKVAAEDIAAWTSARQTRVNKPLAEKLLQAALAERCGLKVQQTPVEVPALVITSRKHELKLTPSKVDEPAPDGWIPLPGGGAFLPSAYGVVPRVLKFHATSMADLTTYLGVFGARVPLLNRTGIEGKFDFELPAMPNDPQAPGFADDEMTILWNVDAIGLELVRTKTVQTAITIDEIHKPTAN